jgi:hypothetical protein
VTVKAVIVRADGDIEIGPVNPTLDGIKSVVGGWLEAIHPTGDQYGVWHAYVDEEGKLKGLPPNPVATGFVTGLGWRGGDVLCGPVVILGEDGEGEEADAPEQVQRAAMRWALIQMESEE